jgi:hypothetical protein
MILVVRETQKACPSKLGLGPVFNNMTCLQGLNLPLGVNLAPRSELCPLGGMFTVSFAPRGEHSLLFRRMEGQKQTISHPRDNFTPVGQLRPWGSKFALRGEVKNGPLSSFEAR